MKRLHTGWLRYRTFWKRQNCSDATQSVVARGGGREEERGAPRVFRAVKTPYGTVMADTRHCTPVGTYGMHAQMSPDANHGHGGMAMTCECEVLRSSAPRSGGGVAGVG